MALKEAYEYMQRNLIIIGYCLPEKNVSFDSENIIQELKEDILKYGIKEPVWIYLKKYGYNFIPYDYLLADHDLLNKENEYVETTLGHALKIFEFLNGSVL